MHSDDFYHRVIGLVEVRVKSCLSSSASHSSTAGIIGLKSNNFYRFLLHHQSWKQVYIYYHIISIVRLYDKRMRLPAARYFAP
jgi:hypothetical protein